MDIKYAFNITADAILYVAKEIPVATKDTITNVFKGCQSSPRGTLTLATALIMANGGAVASYKCAKTSVNALKEKKYAVGIAYAGASVGAGAASIAGGISATLIAKTPAMLWDAYDLSFIQQICNNTLSSMSYALQHPQEMMQFMYEASLFYADRTLKSPDLALGVAACGVVSTAAAATSVVCSKKAYDAFKNGDYVRMGTHAALAGASNAVAVAGIVSSIVPFTAFTVKWW